MCAAPLIGPAVAKAALLNQKLIVYVLRFPALPGVRLNFAEEAESNRQELSMEKASAAEGIALP